MTLSSKAVHQFCGYMIREYIRLQLSTSVYIDISNLNSKLCRLQDSFKLHDNIIVDLLPETVFV